MPFEIKDMNNMPKLLAALQELDSHVVKAGLTEGTKPEILAYGTYNEMGTATIPARSFIRSTADNKRKSWDALTDRLMQSVVDLKQPASRALKKLGDQAEADIKRTINTLTSPPLKPATVKRKGSSKPLIEEGVMLNAISYEVAKE